MAVRQIGKTGDVQAQPAILIVDDEPLIRSLCESALNEYRVFQAGNCEDGLSVYLRERCDVVLADVLMPGESGIELLRRIKEADPAAIVIIMTGFVEKDVILQALKEGADDFINKPLNLLQLRTAVEKSLAKKRLKEEIATLKQLDHLKSNFLSLISHKLRTPITSISLFLQNLRRGVYETDDESFRQNTALVIEETVYLNRMVSDLLAFSRVMEGSAGLHPEPCNLCLIVSEVLQGSHEAQCKPGVETVFSETPLPPLLLDRSKITFALQQVIDNAYKFSGETGRVSVSFQQADNLVRIVVADSGVGIPKDQLDRVCDKFYQIDLDNAGQVRGFGLGLFYAREFVRQHDGTLEIDSVPGRGTTVTISLPLQ